MLGLANHAGDLMTLKTLQHFEFFPEVNG